MLNRSKHKAGYTLVEVLIVVAIMGILSGIGVVGFQSAIANARIKDAAYNVTAYMERTANEARRLNTTLCVKKNGDRKLETYKAACDADDLGSVIDEMELETPNVILANGKVPAGVIPAGFNLVDPPDEKKAQASFVPRQGLSAAPYQGFVVVQYGTRDLYGVSIKASDKNSFVPRLNTSGSWSDL